MRWHSRRGLRHARHGLARTPARADARRTQSARFRRIPRRGRWRQPATAPGSGAARGQRLRPHLVHIARELPEVSGEAPRLYVLTRNAQAVLARRLRQPRHAGLRGLLRAIGAEHPYLHPTHIDVDALTGRGADRSATAGRLAGGRDRLAQRPVVDRAAVPGSAAPRRAGEHGRRPPTRRYAAAASAPPATCRQSNSSSAGRVPPGPGQIEVAVQRVQRQLRRRARGIRPIPVLRRTAATAGPGFRRGGDRGRARRHRRTGSATASAASPRTAVGQHSSPATLRWPRRCRPDLS